MPKPFLRALVSGDESEVDSIVFAGLIALVVVLGLAIWAAIYSPKDFSPINLGTGVGSIIGAAAAGKTGRDRFSPSPLPQADPPKVDTPPGGM